MYSVRVIENSSEKNTLIILTDLNIYVHKYMQNFIFLKFEKKILLIDIEIDQTFYPLYDSDIELSL